MYRVLPAFETVGDSRCVVLVCDGRDRLWLDNDRGFAVAKREWKWSDSDALMFRFTASKLAERAPGLWLPDRVAAELWVKPVPGRWNENIHLKTSTCDVAKLVINEVPADLFDISFPRGTGVVDASVLEREEGGHPVLQYTAGVTAEETQANLDASLRQQQESEGGNTPRSTSIWICSALLLAGLAAVLFFVRSRRRSP